MPDKTESIQSSFAQAGVNGIPSDSVALTPLYPAFRRLAKLSQLESDWDSYGGDPPTARSLDVAHQLLVQVAERFGHQAGDRVRPFAVAPLAEGGVQLEWRTPERDLEIEIGPAGAFGYLFIERRGGQEVAEEADDVSWQDVWALLSRVLPLSLSA